MTEVQLLRVTESGLAVVLGDDPEQPDRIAVLVDRSRRLAVHDGAAIAPAGREDEHERALPPQVGRAHPRAVEQFGGERRGGKRTRRRVPERRSRRHRAGEICGSARRLVVAAAAGEEECEPEEQENAGAAAHQRHDRRPRCEGGGRPRTVARDT